MNKIDYVCWKWHFQGVLQSHYLKYVLEDTIPPPSPPNGEPNPEYLTWSKANQLILTWILLTISSSVQTKILHCVSTKKAWPPLDRYLSPLCIIHIKTLWTKLHTTQKLPIVSMSKFLMNVKNTINTLRVVGSTIQDEEVINYVVDGIDSMY